jgi:hypothetical protein
VPHFTLPIDAAAGPLVTAFVGVSQARGQALVDAGQVVPAAIPVRALVDTGASCTCVDPTVLNGLGLTPTGSVPVHTPSTGAAPHMADQYDVSFAVPGAVVGHIPLIIPAVPVTAADLSAQRIEALIGRDILSNCIFHYNGTTGFLTLAF